MKSTRIILFETEIGVELDLFYLDPEESAVDLSVIKRGTRQGGRLAAGCPLVRT